jgi:uncharacterized protein YbdZ (MbtH family)
MPVANPTQDITGTADEGHAFRSYLLALAILFAFGLGLSIGSIVQANRDQAPSASAAAKLFQNAETKLYQPWPVSAALPPQGWLILCGPNSMSAPIKVTTITVSGLEASNPTNGSANSPSDCTYLLTKAHWGHIFTGNGLVNYTVIATGKSNVPSLVEGSYLYTTDPGLVPVKTSEGNSLITDNPAIIKQSTIIRN